VRSWLAGWLVMGREGLCPPLRRRRAKTRSSVVVVEHGPAAAAIFSPSPHAHGWLVLHVRIHKQPRDLELTNASSNPMQRACKPRAPPSHARSLTTHTHNPRPMPTMPARPLLGPAPARAAEPICGAKSGDGKMGSRPISPSGMASRPVRAPPMGCGCRGQNGVGFWRTGFGRRSPSRNQSDMWCLVFDCFGREREAEREKDGWMEGDGSVASACCTFFFAALALLTRPPSRAPQVLFV